MTKHVIALSGEGDSGKTQTLLTLINKLYEAAHSSERVELFVLDEEGNKVHNDQRVVLEYRRMKIAICTGGDNEKILNDNIKFFNCHDWNIAISATRSKGETINAIKRFPNQEDVQFHTVFKGWVDYPSSSDNRRQQEASDLLVESTAQAMMIIIEGWIDEMIKEKP